MNDSFNRKVRQVAMKQDELMDRNSLMFSIICVKFNNFLNHLFQIWKNFAKGPHNIYISAASVFLFSKFADIMQFLEETKAKEELELFSC